MEIETESQIRIYDTPEVMGVGVGNKEIEVTPLLPFKTKIYRIFYTLFELSYQNACTRGGLSALQTKCGATVLITFEQRVQTNYKLISMICSAIKF